jgi:hypothetical protein
MSSLVQPCTLSQHLKAQHPACLLIENMNIVIENVNMDMQAYPNLQPQPTTERTQSMPDSIETQSTHFSVPSKHKGTHAYKCQLTKNVAPTTQFGLPFPLMMLLPRLRSKMPPMHCVLPVETGPRFISTGLIGHVWPPNDMEMLTFVLQAEQDTTCKKKPEKKRGGNARNWKKPSMVAMGVPPTASQIAVTSAVGPPISVVPVSMADSAAFPVVIDTGFP